MRQPKYPLTDIVPQGPEVGAVVLDGFLGFHQRDSYSCGPVALLTLLRDLGYAHDTDVWEDILTMTEPHPEYGTPTENMSHYMRAVGIPYRTLPLDNLHRKVINTLKRNQPVLVSMTLPHQPSHHSHWCIVVGADHKRVVLSNITRRPLFSRKWFSWDYFLRETCTAIKIDADRPQLVCDLIKI